MEEIDNILAYPSSYKIIQEKDAFSFSIDSTILSFFCDIKKRETRIIDLGTGGGAIPLFLSMFTKRPIYGLEIQEESASRAKRSVLLNSLDNQIKIINDDIKNVGKLFEPSSFSHVVSNPPYFRSDETNLNNKNDYLTIARHESKITMDEIIKSASYLLKDGGTFSMIQRTERFIETIDTLRKHNLVPKRIRFVYPKFKKDSYVFMIDARKNGKIHGLNVLEPLYIYNEDGSYSSEIIKYFHYGEEDGEK